MTPKEIKTTLEKYQSRSQTTEVIMAFGTAIHLIDKLIESKTIIDEEKVIKPQGLCKCGKGKYGGGYCCHRTDCDQNL